MAKKKVFDIDQAAAEILALGLPTDHPDTLKQIKQVATKYKNKTMLELNKMIVEEQQALLDISRQIDSTPDLLARNDLQLKLEKHSLRRQFWETAIALRREGYKRPAAPIGQLLADNGIYTVSPSKPAKKQIKLSDTVGDDSTGEIVKTNSKATIYHPANKELTLQDAKVLIGVHKLWEEAGRPKEFSLSIYNLARAIGRNTGGRSYIQIWDSLETISDTKIQLHLAYETGKIKEVSRFSILQKIGARGDIAQLMFSDVIFDSLQSGALVHLSMAIIEDLQSNTAQGLYPFLASQISQGIDEWKLKDICEVLGLKSPSFKRQCDMIHDACADMVECGLLESFTIDEDEFETKYLRIVPSEILLRTKQIFEQKQKRQLT